jgi:hypothetical protein
MYRGMVTKVENIRRMGLITPERTVELVNEMLRANASFTRTKLVSTAKDGK